MISEKIISAKDRIVYVEKSMFKWTPCLWSCIWSVIWILGQLVESYAKSIPRRINIIRNLKSKSFVLTKLRLIIQKNSSDIVVINNYYWRHSLLGNIVKMMGSVLCWALFWSYLDANFDQIMEAIGTVAHCSLTKFIN